MVVKPSLVARHQLTAELDNLRDELKDKAAQDDVRLGSEFDDDVLTYALFPQIGYKFLQNRDNADAFEPKPEAASAAVAATASVSGEPETYTVNVQGQNFVVEVSPGGDINQIVATDNVVSFTPPASSPAAAAAPASTETKLEMSAPLSGNIFKVNVAQGDTVKQGDVVIILEAMKMETEVRAEADGVISKIWVKEGDSVAVGNQLLGIA